MMLDNDWVKARTNCPLEHVWTVVRERLRADYNQWGLLTTEDHKNVYFNNGNSSVVITKRLNTSASITLTVRIAEDGIEFSTTTGATPGSATRFIPYAAETGECCLFRDGQEFPVWQVSRDFLGPVLFASA